MTEQESDLDFEEWQNQLTPRGIVEELDKYIVGQDDAKKAVAIALRNRWRRRRVEGELREEILPNNLILIGPTGVGKTEISRRLARLAGAPFVKVEASKFTEVGYVGRDVESMIRDLVDTSVNMVRSEREAEVEEDAEERVEERLLDLLLPITAREGPAPVQGPDGDDQPGSSVFVAGPTGVAQAPASSEDDGTMTPADRRARTREKLRKLLRDGALEDREVEVEVSQSPSIEGMMIPMGGMEGMDHNFTEMLQDMLPKKTKRRTVTVGEARRIFLQEELDRLVDMDEVVNEAMDRAEDAGIIFLDEIDKIAGTRGGAGPDVSREGVQRDLLPVVEGSNVQTKYGFVRTDHMLFIAAGAFHVAKPSDLIPELQGRFPIRVELESLGEDHFVRILKEPKNALLHQYAALVETEGASLEFTEEGVLEVARIAAQLNDRMENIGARRLQTVLTTVLEDLLFDLPDTGEGKVVVDPPFVRERLAGILDDEDLQRYILRPEGHRNVWLGGQLAADITKVKEMRYFIGDVRDQQRLELALRDVDVVIHAAAMKHVHIAEYNPDECVKTNIDGARNVIDACLETGVERVVALSTDKAAAPVNLYGATKLASDKLFVAANNIVGWNPIKFSVVRYGNVMGSNGSVIPFFLKKRKEGVLPITNPEMTRFNISLQGGVDMVMHALETAWGGEIFVPKIPSYKITDVAEAIGPECEKPVIGIRPGEKIHEEMITDSDSFYTWDLGKYYTILPSMHRWKLADFVEHFKAKKVSPGFKYNSGENTTWETVESLRKLIKEHVDPTFEVLQ